MRNKNWKNTKTLTGTFWAFNLISVLFAFFVGIRPLHIMFMVVFSVLVNFAFIMYYVLAEQSEQTYSTKPTLLALISGIIMIAGMAGIAFLRYETMPYTHKLGIIYGSHLVTSIASGVFFASVGELRMVAEISADGKLKTMANKTAIVSMVAIGLVNLLAVVVLILVNLAFIGMFNPSLGLTVVVYDLMFFAYPLLVLPVMTAIVLAYGILFGIEKAKSRNIIHKQLGLNFLTELKGQAKYERIGCGILLMTVVFWMILSAWWATIFSFTLGFGFVVWLNIVLIPVILSIGTGLETALPFIAQYRFNKQEKMKMQKLS